ncbi:MAG: hypothetical protein GEU82_10750 [Luteitalea sp.]|nr:hypothetical protein [Luteitalea sp.]
MVRRLLTTALSVVLTAAPALALQPPPAPDGFVPIDTLPPTEQLPAGPFLVGAYVFFLLLMMFYLWTIWRRLAKVESEMRELERRTERGQAR